MRKQKEVVINSDKYLLTQFGGMEGVRIGKKVAKIMLPIFSSMFAEDQVEPSMMDIMTTVGEHLDEIDDETVVKLISSVTKNGYAIKFDDEFAGNYSTLFKLLWEVVQFNFSDLLFLEPTAEETEQ